MRAGRFTADGEPGRSVQQRWSVLEEMEHGVLAVVRPGRIWVLGGEPVIDARGGEAGLVGELLQGHVLHVVPAQGPASTVNVEVDTGRSSVRADETHFDRTAPARDLYIPRLLQERWRRKDPLTCSPRAPSELWRNRVDQRLRCDEGLELGVERPRLVYIMLLDVRRGVPNR